MEYLERRECEHDQKTYVNFFKEEDDSKPILTRVMVYTPLSGFHGVLSGFLVAVKQAMPDQEVKVLG